MPLVGDFKFRLEEKVVQQLSAQRVGYLLGAGSSFLNNSGYPLASQLWGLIKDRITDSTKRSEIQTKLDSGASGIEEALDLLDNGQAIEGPHRHLVTAAIADLFQPLSPSLGVRAPVRRDDETHPSPEVARLSRVVRVRHSRGTAMFLRRTDPAIHKAIDDSSSTAEGERYNDISLLDALVRVSRKPWSKRRPDQSTCLLRIRILG